MKFLIDENLSPDVVRFFADRGVFAQHVAHIGLVGATDATVWQYAFDHDQTVVTVNGADYAELARSSDLHAGLVIILEGGLSRAAQCELLLSVLDELGDDPDLVNQVIEVSP